jgi:hypothetical protein
LYPFQRGIHASACSAGGGFFGQHIPRLQRLPQFEPNTIDFDLADLWKTELQVHCEPLVDEGITSAAKSV